VQLVDNLRAICPQALKGCAGRIVRHAHTRVPRPINVQVGRGDDRMRRFRCLRARESDANGLRMVRSSTSEGAITARPCLARFFQGFRGGRVQPRVEPALRADREGELAICRRIYRGK